MKTPRFPISFALGVFLLAGRAAFAQLPPKERVVIDPQLPWSERMALSEILRQQQGVSSTYGKDGKHWDYATSLVLCSIQDVWRKTGKAIYYEFPKSFGDSMVKADGTILSYEVQEYNIDNVTPGNVLFLLYEKTKEERYRKALALLRSQLDGQPRVYSGGFWHKKIYTNQMWLDGLFMGSPFYAHYEQQFGTGTNFEDVARQFIIMERQARDFETGLLYHGWDSAAKMFWADPITGLSKNFWGRGIGWYAMGLVDALDYFPKDHPRRPELIAILRRVCDAMAKVQDPSGVWWQVVNRPNGPGNYKEATVTSMMTCAVLKGVRMGYLAPSYLDMAAKSWNGMLAQFVTVDADDHEVHMDKSCQVAGLGGAARRDGTYEYYVREKIRFDDGKAVGPFIRSALEIESMDQWLPPAAASKQAMFNLK